MLVSLCHHLCSLKWPVLRCKICVYVFLVHYTFFFQGGVMCYPYYECKDLNKHECEVVKVHMLKPFPLQQ